LFYANARVQGLSISTLFYMAMYETPEAPMPTSSGKTLSNKTMWEFLKNHFDP
jgi:hypothetical protein